MPPDRAEMDSGDDMVMEIGVCFFLVFFFFLSFLGSGIA